MKEKKLSTNIMILITIIGGIIGFIYETIFYRIDLGYFVKRGSTFGPWIPIYAFGSLFLTIIAYKHHQKPIIVFLLSLIITTILEYGTGYTLLKIFNTRLWDYNTEIWNFGNINGFICLRSVLLFAIAGLFLCYLLIPCLIKIEKKDKNKRLNIISPLLLILFITDMLLYHILKIIM